MKLYQKLVLLLFVSALSVVIFVLWPLADHLEQNEILRHRESIKQQTSSLTSSVQSYAQNLAAQILYIGKAEELALQQGARFYSPKALSKEFGGSPFLGIGQLIKGKKWQVKWLSVQDEDVSVTNFEKDISAEVFNELVTDQGMSFRPIDVGDGQTYILAIMGNKKSYSFALLDRNYFSKLSYPYRGSDNQLFLIGQNSYALAHPEMRFLGRTMDDHFLAKQIAMSSVKADTFLGKDLNDRLIVGGFEKVEGTNLHVALMLPVVGLLGFMEGGWLAIGLGFVLALILSIAITWRFLGSLISQKDFVEKLPESNESPPPEQSKENDELPIKVVVPLEPPISTPEYSQEERNKHIMSFANNVSQSLLDPITTLLGHLHILRGQPEVKSAGTNFRQLEEEARRIKTFAEDLRRLAKQENLTLQPVQVEEIANRVVRDRMDLFNRKTVRLQKNLLSKDYIRANEIYLEKTLQCIVDFFVAMLDEQVQRELFIDLNSSKNDLLITIAANCEKLKATELEEMMLLHTASSMATRETMGLAVAQSLVTSMGGFIDVFDSPNGVAIKVSWVPLSEEDVQDFLAASTYPDEVVDEQQVEPEIEEEFVMVEPQQNPEVNNAIEAIEFVESSSEFLEEPAEESVEEPIEEPIENLDEDIEIQWANKTPKLPEIPKEIVKDIPEELPEELPEENIQVSEEVDIRRPIMRDFDGH